MARDILHDQRHRGRHDLVDRLFRHAVAIAPGAVLAPSGIDGDLGRIVVLKQCDDAVAHLHEGRKHINDTGEGCLQPVRRSQDLRDFVYAGERDLAQRNRLRRAMRRPRRNLHIAVSHDGYSIDPQRLLTPDQMYNFLHYALDSKRCRAELFSAIAKKRGDFQQSLPKNRDDCALCVHTSASPRTLCW